MIATSFHAGASRRHSAGFTLVELMVGAAVGLLATLVIALVMSKAEGFKRSAASGTDAQVNGGMAIYALQRQLKMAGYGLITASAAQGCTLSAKQGMGTLPTTLAPVLITAGANGASDQIRVLGSSKTSYSLPTKVIAPYYDPHDTTGKALRFAVATALGANGGDLMAVIYGADKPCQIFQVSADPSIIRQIDRVDDGKWNQPGFPDTATTPLSSSFTPFLVNLGALSDVTYSISADFRLQQSTVDYTTLLTSSQDVQSNIVVLKALYGKDTDMNATVDTYDNVGPKNNAEWMQVKALRVAVLARSAQYEKDEVTTTLPQWDVGSVGTIPDASTCGTSKCITLHADLVSSDWKHYRYKVFDTLVPLRNQVWSDFVTTPGAATSSGQ
ncbi:PilW family protein [Roseateles koreensis]|uniref:PilW family protein n=1 Tax=Roseateles koreensis TaxID=2987526 RepID=A0ABT5KRF5_9BURK|nr:PilW family protein [Roseateles koreensis]MDC8785493.1 PilW family protein [Roseateles koreensis]